MTDDDKQVTTPDEYDPTSDPRDLLIVDALAELVMQPLDDDDDLEADAEALTDDDRRASAALGSSAELVARIIANANAKNRSRLQAERPTRMRSSLTTITKTAVPPKVRESAEEFGELLQRMRDCECDDLLSWSCDYRKKEVIGRGGQGIVFLTECLNEHYLPKALKVFSPQPYGDAESYYDDMDRMAHVASLVYRIQVDNLVIVERFAYHNGICVMIMRWIDGHDLATLLRPSLFEQLRGCVNEERWKHLTKVVVTTPGTSQLRLMPGMAVNIIEKCLRGLDALHSHGIVHGDIKPSNIMLDRYGSIRLVDIGSAFELSAPPRQHTWTPRYAPPEIFEGKKWTPQSDLASLGYVLIELLSGQPAIASPDIGSASTRMNGTDWDRMILDEKRALPERLNELLPANVRASDQLMKICQQLIDPDPKKRFASAEDALEGPSGTYKFLQDLTRMNLAACFSQEIKRWLADVKMVRP